MTAGQTGPDRAAGRQEAVSVAAMIDHALLHPALTENELEEGYAVAARLGVASVCVMPFALRRCAERLAGTAVVPSTVIGFPLGVHRTSVKAAEAEAAVEDGAAELDVVVNISLARSGAWDDVRGDLRAMIDPAHAAGRRVKVIFENCYHDRATIERLCAISTELGAGWVKTSTGFGTDAVKPGRPTGAVLDEVRLMRASCPASVGVKASGGVRTLAALMALRDAGCSRVGTSSTERIVAEALAVAAGPRVSAELPAPGQ